MGLFTSSETTNKRNQILQDIAVINRTLRDVANIIEIQGINGSSVNSITAILTNIEANVVRMSSTVQSMSDSQLTGFTVPWMDGRYIGIMTWIASYGSVMNKTVSEIENYTRR